MTIGYLEEVEDRHSLELKRGLSQVQVSLKGYLLTRFLLWGFSVMLGKATAVHSAELNAIMSAWAANPRCWMASTLAFLLFHRDPLCPGLARTAAANLFL